MEEKINELLKRFEEVEALLSDVAIVSNQKKYKELAGEHSYLLEIKEIWEEYQETVRSLKENQSFYKQESDAEMLEVIREEISLLEKNKELLYKKLENLLVPPDPRDHRPIIVELRAGTGGDEAAIFVGDCVRMYKNYAVANKWNVETLSCTSSEAGGFKEYIMVLSGKNVFRLMQYEAGTHRVQRVPLTETQGRVHTSTITVAVLLEPDEQEQVKIDEKDLKIDTYRASGAGGQHVNTTDSAVRITHMPTGTVVYCQEERSQHKNKEKALRFLSAKIAEEKRRKEEEAIASLRLSQVGTGDRSERIRTYNFPQNRVTDHRIDLTLYKLDRVMEGDLDDIAPVLVAYYHDIKLKTSRS